MKNNEIQLKLKPSSNPNLQDTKSLERIKK